MCQLFLVWIFRRAVIRVAEFRGTAEKPITFVTANIMAGVISVPFAGFRMTRSKHGSRLINNLFRNIFLGVKDIVIEIKHFIIPRK